MKNINVEKYSFYLGIFFLASAPVISVFLLLISLIRSSNNLKYFFNNFWNKILLATSLLMLTSCILQNFIGYEYPLDIDKSLTWIGLINWIPLFWCFWAFQPYLRNINLRKKTTLFLISGTIPVIFSGLAQYWFDITGPWEILRGTIIWYQRPIEITDGLTGPFNNANYAGAWLAMVWPFVIANHKIDNSKIRKSFSIILIFLFIISIIYTNSRNAWIGLFISIPILMGRKIAIFTLIVISSIFIFLSLSYYSLLPNNLAEAILNNLPHNFMSNFPEKLNQISEEFPRLQIWGTSLKFISLRPFLGWGAGTFPILYEIENSSWIGHTHNLLFEIAISYGIFPAILLVIFIFSILFKSINSEFKTKHSSNYVEKNNHLFNKAWICAIFFLTFAHLIDIQYFDLRISIISWILLAGLRAMLLEKKQYS